MSLSILLLTFSAENIQQICELAELNDLEIIPLVQTFGHMEVTVLILMLTTFALCFLECTICYCCTVCLSVDIIIV